MGVFTYQEPAIQRNIALGERLNSLYQDLRVNNYTICDYANSIGPNRTAGQKMQRKPAVTYDDCVAGICAAAISYNDIAVLGKNVDNFAFAFVTPL
jgi:hypothetical protein